MNNMNPWIFFTFYVIVSVSGKALYGSQSETNHLPLQLEPNTVLHIDSNHNSINNPEVLSNGVDINLESLNDNGRKDILNRNMIFNDDASPGQEKQDGVAIDLPNKISIDPYRFLYLLDMYLQQQSYQVLVRLDAMPDYILVPRNFLFDFAAASHRLVDFNDQMSIVKGPSAEHLLPSFPTKDKMLNTVVQRDVQPLNSEPVLEQTNLLHKGTLTETKGDSNYLEPGTVENVSRNEKSNSVTVVKEVLQKDRNVVEKELNQRKERKSPVGVRTVSKSIRNSEALLPSNPLRVLSASSSVDTNAENELHTGSKTKSQNLPQENLASIGGEPGVLKAHAQQGNGLKLASNQQTNEVSEKRLPPLRAIFGGESLFKPTRKVRRLFNKSPKQEALMNFEG